MMLGYDYTQVNLEGNVPASYSVVATANSTRLELACPSDREAGSSTSSHIGMRCGSDGLRLNHIDQTLDELTVTISWKDGSKSETFHPDYEPWYPNGKGCDMRQQAFLTMHLP
jgi:hypothetical protein